MRIQLISHASVVVFCDDIGIWTDPWLVGKAFNNSWALLPEPSHVEVPYDKIKYLWISHEHPDHFNIPTLKSLPEEFKKSVTVLFQKTNSDKVFAALSKLGYENFLPLENKKLTLLESGMEVYCYQNHFIDSCLGVRHKGQVIFNVNDAELEPRDCKEIVDDLGSVDVCLNQFSLAGYRGFAQRDEHLPRMAHEKINRMLENHYHLNATYTLPFASFVYFCCSDNRYMNRYVNKPETVFQRFKAEGYKCALLYLNDVWDIREPFSDSMTNLCKYRQLFDHLDELPYDEPPLVPEYELTAAFEQMSEILHDRYPRFILDKIQPFSVYIPDYGGSYRFDLRHKTCKPLLLKEADSDLTAWSQPLHFGFKFPFGVETLAVSARVTIRHHYANWQRFKRLCVLNSADIYLHPRYLFQFKNIAYLWARATSSLFSQVMSRAQRHREMMDQTLAPSGG